MSAIDLVMDEVQSRFGLSGTKASSLLSGLLSFITSQSGGISGFIERFRSAGLGDVLTSLFSGATRNLSGDQVESVLGSSTISNLASKAGISTTTASSAIALMLPKLIQSIAPGGAIPTKLPAELMSYLGGPTAAVAGGARHTVYAAERAAQRGIGRYLWPVLALLAAILLGIWIWSRSSASSVAFNAEEQVRLAAAKASSALAALRPGFSAQDLVNVLNFDIINFQSGSATIPADGTDFLNKAAVAMRAAAAGTVIQVGGAHGQYRRCRHESATVAAARRCRARLSSQAGSGRIGRWRRVLGIRSHSRPMTRRKANFGIGGLSFRWYGEADLFVQYARIVTVRALFLSGKRRRTRASLKPTVLQKGKPKRELIERPRHCILVAGDRVNGEVVDGVWLVTGSYDCSSFVGGESCSTECAGDGTRHHVGGVVVFVERFLWSWYVSGLNAQKSGN